MEGGDIAVVNLCPWQTGWVCLECGMVLVPNEEVMRRFVRSKNLF